MLHYYTQFSSDAHYSAASNCDDSQILVQVQNEHGDQARVRLTICEARHLISLIEEAAKEVEAKRNQRNKELNDRLR